MDIPCETIGASWVRGVMDRLHQVETDNAQLRRELDERLPLATNISGLQLQIRTRHDEDGWFFSIPVYMDTPKLQHLEDFSKAFCKAFLDAHGKDYDDANLGSLCMAISAWEDSWPDNQPVREIKYTDGVLGPLAVQGINTASIAETIQTGWRGALVGPTGLQNLCSIGCVTGGPKIQGYVQKTSHYSVWSDLITCDDNSGYFNPAHGNYTVEGAEDWWPMSDKWQSIGETSRFWFAEFCAAIAEDSFKLSSLKSRQKMQKLIDCIPSAY